MSFCPSAPFSPVLLLTAVCDSLIPVIIPSGLVLSHFGWQGLTQACDSPQFFVFSLPVRLSEFIYFTTTEQKFFFLAKIFKKFAITQTSKGKQFTLIFFYHKLNKCLLYVAYYM